MYAESCRWAAAPCWALPPDDMRISKKLTVTVIASLLLLVERRWGFDLDAETKQQIAYIVCAYLAGQGIADWKNGGR